MAVHHFEDMNYALKLILPAIKYFMNNETRFRMVTHSISSKEEMIPYGFVEKHLPTSLGGFFELDSNWVNGKYELNDPDILILETQ